jgi:hypothetical protein
VQADGLIPIKQMYHYYNDVLKNDPDVADFYRLFAVPAATAVNPLQHGTHW